MSLAECRECRLALVHIVCDLDGEPLEEIGCQIADDLPLMVGDRNCPIHVSLATPVPAPTRSCKKSRGEVGGCGTGGCSLSGGGCSSGGCSACAVADVLGRLSQRAA